MGREEEREKMKTKEEVKRPITSYTKPTSSFIEEKKDKPLVNGSRQEILKDNKEKDIGKDIKDNKRSQNSLIAKNLLNN